MDMDTHTHTQQSPQLYLYYSLKIEPFDAEAVDIKKHLDLGRVVKNYPILLNAEVKKYFDTKTPPEFCPVTQDAFIDTCYAEYTENSHLIKILFYKINKCELLTAAVIFGSDTKNVLTALHRTINLQNNLLQDYDKYFNAELDNIIRVMKQPRYYNLSKIYVKDPKGIIFSPVLNEFPIEEVLKIPLFDYQRDNVNWMIELERNPIRDYVSSQKIFYFPDGRIFNYDLNRFVTNAERELVSFRGGVILDDVGVGKTFQALCLAMTTPDINTLILVPDHLEKHWHSQFKKHFNLAQMPSFITIVIYSNFKSSRLEKYGRMICDEIHELYSNPQYKNILEGCFRTGCKYKWGISATPFPVPNSILNLMRYLTEKELFYTNTDRFSYFYDTYYKIFRKNTLDNIVGEIRLPNSFEHNLLLDFNDQERILYDAETQANANCDEYFLRKCCCDVMINFKNKTQILTLDDFNNLVLNDYRTKYLDEKEKLDKYIEFHDNCVDILKKIDEGIEIEEIKEILKKTPKKELIENIKHYHAKILEQQKITNDRKLAFDYLESKINDTNKTCPYCMGDITNENKYDVPKCGHIHCTDCMNEWLVSHTSCSVCMRQILREDIYTITNLKQIKLKYSTKIDKLIEILLQMPNQNEKIIVFTQFGSLIDKLHETLNIERFGSIKFEKPEQIDEFRSNPSKRVLILSSVKNASGIDLSFVSNIVIFEPIIGDTLFLRDIEKQIVGRIYRINQTRDINIYRFIVKNTIEETIFNKACELR